MKRNYQHNLAIAILVSALFALAGCSSERKANSSAMSEDVIAMVADSPISVAALLVELGRQGAPDKQAALDRLIRRQLILDEVKRTGFGDTPNIRKAWDDFVIARFTDVQRQKIDPLTEPEPSELQTYFETHRDAYSTPERRRVALIFLRRSDSRQGSEALAIKSADIRERALADSTHHADFGLLAAQYSDHRPSRNSGGDLGWIVPSAPNTAWPREVLAGIQNLTRPGDISPVIVAREGCYLLKLIAWQPSEAVPLEQVRERVSYDLVRERARQAEVSFYSQLQSNFPVRINAERFEAMSMPAKQVAEAQPPRAPNR